MAIYHVPGDVIGITSNYLKEEGRRETGGSVASSMYVDHETLAGGSLKAAGFDRIYILDFEGREGRIWKSGIFNRNFVYAERTKSFCRNKVH